jgi:hypothetical protein
MQEDLFDPVPDVKLYTGAAVRVGTFLGGPLIAGYLIAENFKNLGQPDNARKSWLWAIVSTIVIYAGVLFIPGIEKVPNYIIPLIYTGAAALIFQYQQSALVEKHVARGGVLYSVWRGVLAGIAGLLLMIAIVLAIMYLTESTGFETTN